MLEIFDVTVAYRKDKPTLEGISLSVAKGDILGVLGMNGAGKTTLFNTIYGLVNPVIGSINLSNSPITHTSISYLETQNYFYPYMRGIEYLNLVTKGKFNRKLNKIFELPLDHLVDTYSTGMKKKLAFWAVFELKKEVVLLDEPFNGVDLESVECLYYLILEMRQQGRIIIISSHIIETLTRICDQISYLSEGKIKKTYKKKDYPKLQVDLQKIIQAKIQATFLLDEQKYNQ